MPLTPRVAVLVISYTFPKFCDETDRVSPKIELNPGLKPYNNEVAAFKSRTMYIHYSMATRRRLQLYRPHVRSIPRMQYNNIGEKELKKREKQGQSTSIFVTKSHSIPLI